MTVVERAERDRGIEREREKEVVTTQADANPEALRLLQAGALAEPLCIAFGGGGPGAGAAEVLDPEP